MVRAEGTLTHWNLLILIQEGLRFVHGGMRKCPGMMHTSALILFNQPVNKVKTCPGSAPFQALLPGPVMTGGSSSVITPVGQQRAAELKEPWMDASSGALAGDPAFKQHAARGDPSAPARCAPASRCWLKCSRLLVLRSGAREGGASRIIIMLLWCHLQHKTEGELNIPPTCEKRVFFKVFPSS